MGIKPGGHKNYAPKFLQYLEAPPNKTQLLFVSYLGSTSKYRENIPVGPKLNVSDYYDAMANSQFVISPEGDRPECYRHYEAIGLGTIPVTNLNPRFYSHLTGSAVFNTSDWRLETLEKVLRNDENRQLQANKNMLFEEYWLEYVEHVVGYPIFWWDMHQKRKSLLADFIPAPSPTAKTKVKRNATIDTNISEPIINRRN